jgi:glycosyltransferase involved in cell wall biosynthesis
MMMRILLLSQFYPPVIGGEERHVRNLALALAARGHEVSVATQAGREPSGMTMDGAVRLWRIRGTAQRAGTLFSDPVRPFAPPFPDPELLFGLRRVVSSEKPDIIHAHNWLLHSYLPLRLVSQAPFVVTLHDYSLLCARKNYLHMGRTPCGGPGARKCLMCASQHYGNAKGWITTLGNWVDGALECRAVDMFLAVSCAVARINRLPERGVPFEIVPNFVPDAIADLSRDLDPRLADLPAEYMLYVGDLSVQKGVQLLLDAYRRTGTTVPLLMIGRPLPDFPASVPKGVKVLGAWPHAAVMQASRRCLFGIAPSIWHEPCATVVIEAMALGRAMVVSDLGGMPDLVQHMETGLVVRPAIEPLAVAMRRLLDDAALREQLGASAAARVGRFQEHSVVQRIETIYQALAMQRVRARQPDEAASLARPRGSHV